MPERIAEPGVQAAGRQFVFDRSIQEEKSGLTRLFSQLPPFALSPWHDLRNDREWWARGVDYILEGGVKVDFKVEKQRVRNCAAELIKADRPSLRPGWLLSSESHWIIHYFEQTGEIVCLPTHGYRELVLKGCQSGELRDAVSAANYGRRDSELLYLTWNALLPVNKALRCISGAFWSKIEGPVTPGILDEARDGLAVPIEWLSLWLQQGAIAPKEHDPQLAGLGSLLEVLKPYDRARRTNQQHYRS
ncbi:glycosyltransferase [Novimethylophilus kurashikiensis]|uniref:Glycosyltransferase n=1 Tax=Novimethylophilus kurashikiensis TaxID=1825523 RepID=A0A2R5F7R2_9PROT|nr:hypothetical protein [Novimethylophilus kurashikiensis]GBG14280.1 glycosyltransferase [Novimethylophilus kurashikiensis]